MYPTTRTVTIQCAAATTQSLPADAIAVVSATLISGSGTALTTAVQQTVVSATPSSGDVQFTGTKASPSKTLTFSSALTVDDVLEVEFVPVGGY